MAGLTLEPRLAIRHLAGAFGPPLRRPILPLRLRVNSRRRWWRGHRDSTSRGRNGYLRANCKRYAPQPSLSVRKTLREP